MFLGKIVSLKNIFMKKYFFLLLAGGALWTACGDNAGNGNDTASDSSTINSSGDTITSNTDLANKDTTSIANAQPLDSKAQEFASKATTGGMMEVDLGQLAQQNASDARVKDFGAMMVKDHSAANQELQTLVSRRNFTPKIDHEKHEKMKASLAKKTGPEFDKAYIKMMVEDHKKDVKEFEDAAQNATDPDIKAYASKTLPVLKAHLDSAVAISRAKKY
jgi:putative membrane protein